MSLSSVPSDFTSSGELRQPTMSHSEPNCCHGTGRLQSRIVRKAKRAVRSTALLAEFQERCKGVW